MRSQWGEYELKVEGETVVEVEVESSTGSRGVVLVDRQTGTKYELDKRGWIDPGEYEVEIKELREYEEAESAELGGPLLEVYPNPMRERATIRYKVEEVGPVKIEVYDLLGRKWLRWLIRSRSKESMKCSG